MISWGVLNKEKNCYFRLHSRYHGASRLAPCRAPIAAPRAPRQPKTQLAERLRFSCT